MIKTKIMNQMIEKMTIKSLKVLVKRLPLFKIIQIIKKTGHNPIIRSRKRNWKIRKKKKRSIKIATVKWKRKWSLSQRIRKKKRRNMGKVMVKWIMMKSEITKKIRKMLLTQKLKTKSRKRIRILMNNKS